MSKDTINKKTSSSDRLKIRTENSRKIAEFIKEKIGKKWTKLSKCKAGNDRLDAILIYLFFSKYRVITTTSYDYSKLGSIDKQSKIIIDFIKEENGPKDLQYSAKGFAVFAYEKVLDYLYNAQHSLDWDNVDKFRPANRNMFKIFEINRSFNDFVIEYDDESDSDC